MNTKKIYVAPAMTVVTIETSTFIAASGDLGVGGNIGLRDDIEDAGDE